MKRKHNNNDITSYKNIISIYDLVIQLSYCRTLYIHTNTYVPKKENKEF